MSEAEIEELVAELTRTFALMKCSTCGAIQTLSVLEDDEDCPICDKGRLIVIQVLKESASDQS